MVWVWGLDFRKMCDDILRFRLPFEDLDATNPDIAFKFWHFSVNGNDLRESNLNSGLTNSTEKVEPQLVAINKFDAYPS
jgi:hypothetical protein